MKITTLSRRLYAVTLALLLGVAGAWADEISLPCTQINFKDNYTAKSSQGGFDNNNAYHLGSFKGGSYIEVTLNNETAQDYLLAFQWKVNNNDAKTITVTLTNSSSEQTYQKVFNVYNTSDNWRDVLAEIPSLPIDTYTMRIETTNAEGKGGSWSPNIWDMAIVAKSGAEAYNTRNISSIDLSKAITTGTISKKANMLDGTANSATALLIVNCVEAGVYNLNFNASAVDTGVSIDARVCSPDGVLGGGSTNFSVSASGDSKDWNQYQSFSLENISLTAGYNVVRLGVNKGGGTSLSWAATNMKDFYLTKISPLNTIPGTSFDMSIGVTAANTDSGFKARISDLDSNQQNSIVCYAVNTTAAGNYILNFLMTSRNTANSKVQFVVTDENGTQISDNTVSIAKTDDWGIAYANSYSVNLGSLPVGRNTIKMTFTADNKWAGNVFNIQILQALTLDETTAYTPAAGLANVTMTRTMNANQWQTFVAPFAMTEEQVETAFGSDVKVAKLTGKSGDALDFSTGNKTITANVPVMIYPSQAVTEITADGVTIVEGTPTQSESGVSFVGNYGGRIAIPKDAYFVADNQLYVASDGSNNIKNWRAYFTIPTGARLSGMTFDNGETTGISATLMNSEESTVNSVFDLQGRRISQPQKGLYIVKGKKVIIK